MDIPASRRSWVLSAIVLMTLAPSSWAADKDSGKTLAPSSSIEDLKSDLGRPEDFQRFVEGSREKQGGLDLPSAFARSDGRGSAASIRLSRPRVDPRPGPFVPAALAAGGRKTALVRDSWPPDFPVRKLAAVLGLGFFLIAASMLETPIESAPTQEVISEALPLCAPPSAVRAPETAPLLARAEDSPSRSPFIDTRMPVPTWRAITWREQQLIERWNSSREKSLGLASLAQWLDAKGCVDGVDIALLKTKLLRET